MRILLVEDDASLASGLVLALQRARYRVEHVADGFNGGLDECEVGDGLGARRGGFE